MINNDNIEVVTEASRVVIRHKNNPSVKVYAYADENFLFVEVWDDASDTNPVYERSR